LALQPVFVVRRIFKTIADFIVTAEGKPKRSIEQSGSIGARLEYSLRKSFRRLEQEAGVSGFKFALFQKKTCSML
jgi:hypothetical protein